ncbi:MAG: hypothetical protein LBM73_00435 [Candidatus Nomurabacteria bacterium]|jgi:hypothetical protein|nr:hypothetical protein [Candidatus Nomurabacteria bacterium]
MSKFGLCRVIAEPAPKPRSKWAPRLGLIAAAIMIVMALLQLFRFDKFLPELNAQLPGGRGFADFVAIAVVLCEIYSLPFLFRLKLSRLARLCSGVVSFLPPWIWLIVTIWTTGSGATAVEFSSYFPLATAAWTILFNVIWLIFSFVVAWQNDLGKIKVLPIRSTEKSLAKSASDPTKPSGSMRKSAKTKPASQKSAKRSKRN